MDTHVSKHLEIVKDLGRVAEDPQPVTGRPLGKQFLISECEANHSETPRTCIEPDSLLNVPHTGTEWLDGFIEWLQAGGVSTGTVRVRTRYIGLWLRQVEDPSTATPADVAAFLSVPTWKPETRRSARASIRVFYHWALDAGLVTSDPTKGSRPVMVPRALPRPASESAVEAAISAAVGDVRLAILLAAYAGLRRAEIACLHADDIGADSIVVHGKGGHLRRVPINPRLAAPLATARELGGWVFPSPVRKGKHVDPDYIGRRLAKALPPGFSGHTLRHRFGTQIYRGSKDLRVTQELLGHSSVATTQRYVEVSNDALYAAVANL